MFSCVFVLLSGIITLCTAMYIPLFTLFLLKYIRLASILSRDVFVLTRIKTRMVFPKPPPQYSE